MLLVTSHPRVSEPRWTRTTNLELKRLLLYPVELAAQDELPEVDSNHHRAVNSREFFL
jgi:hypothetical protein